MEERPRKIHVRTFGCQMNDYDSERMYRLMEREGWVRTSAADDADLIVINTCSVREKADHKAVSEVGLLRRHKERRPGTLLALSGCTAQVSGAQIMKRMPELDLVIGTHAIDKLPDLVREAAARRVINVKWDYEGLVDFDAIAPLAESGEISWKGTRASGFVAIMRGCDKHCAFCIVPQTRGREISRPMGDIVAEVRSLVDAGVRDITLLGQIVNRYGRGLDGQRPIFHRLIRALTPIDGLARLRFTSSHPTYVTPELIRCFAEEPKLAPHVHLPVQSGSDTVLRHMKRGHKIDTYLEKVRELRRVRPEMSITTDLIVGYPDETRDDFEATLDLIREVEFDHLFAFKYSTRPNTPAAALEDRVPEGEKAERLARLHEMAQPIILRRNRALEGRVLEVIVEGTSRNGTDVFGRSGCNRIVHFPDRGFGVGETVAVRIETGLPNALRGRAEAAGAAATA